MQNRARAEQLGFAALPETLEGWQPAAAPTALRPVTGQDTWYRLGLHVLPEELNAAVLEALAAEAAGLPTPSAQTGYATALLLEATGNLRLTLGVPQVADVRLF